MKNLVFNLRTAKAQAEGCAKVTKSSWMAKVLTALTLLLTLSVGQTWAGAGFYEVYFTYSYSGTTSNATYTNSTSTTQTIDLGTLTADFKITSIYLKYWKDGSGNMCGGLVDYYISSDQEYQPSWTWTPKGGNNHELSSTASWTIAQYNTGASGSYTFWYRFKTWGSSSSSSGCSDNYYIPTNSNNKNKFTYNIAPPAVSGFGVSTSGFLAGSGTSEDPYLVKSGNSLTFTVSGSKARTDANSTFKYWLNSGTKMTSGTLSTGSITSTSLQSAVVHGQCINNSSSSLVGTESTSTIYYKAVSVKDISVYIYVGGRTSAEINSVEMNGCTPYVGTKALSSVKINNQSAGAPKFTLSGNWLVYTFEDVTKVSNITCARSGGNIFTGEITDNVYYMYDGTELDGQCIPRTTPTWNVAPANGAAGGSMTASINNVPAGATVTWSSTATSYATVNSSGVISYVATGSATIKARIQKAASDDYCALDYTLSQAITVTSGATITATRTCSEYVAAGVAGQVSASLVFTGTSSGWKYRIKQGWSTGYETAWLDASGTSANWTMTGGMDAETRTYVAELYETEGASTPVSTSNFSVTGETAYSTTIAAGSNGSVSPKTVYANNNHVHPSITATPNSHYHFVNWTSSNAAASVASTTSASTTVTATAAGYTITANFAGDQYVITYKDQGNVAYSGNNSGSLPATHTYGTATALVNGTKTGYDFAGWYTDADCTSSAGSSIGATAKTANFTLYAKWTEKITTVTVNVSPTGAGTLTVGGAAFTPGNTTTAGVSTSRTVVATKANDYNFSSWSVTGNATGTSSTNTYTLKGNGSAGTGTLTANFTLVPCKLYKLSAAKNGSTTDKGAMSYDPTVHAYYKDITTDASPYYFRFYYNNSAQYCTDWKDKYDGGYTSGKQITANDTKVDCNQSVGGWKDKPAMYYSGESGTTIRIWFDYQNKKVWITADKDKQYVLRGANADDASKADGMPGWSATTSYFVGLASGNTGTISCSLNAGEWYHLKVYDMYNKTWYGTSTSGAKELIDGTLATMGSYDDFYFGTTVADSYTFTLDKSSGMKIKVDYPVSYQLNYSIGSVAGTEGSITTSPSTPSGSYVPSGNVVTLTAPNEKTGYSWDGWYLNEAGTGDKQCATKAYAVTMNETKTLYACYTQDDYTITLNGNSGTGHTASVTAHYGEFAPVDDGVGGHKFSITNPDRDGYTFAGWYTNSDGTGTMLINPDGYLTWSIDGFTDGTGKWIATSGTNLYARWKTNASVGKYNFQYGSGTWYSSSWTLMNFGDADDHERTIDFTLIDPTSKKFFVGYDGDFQSVRIGEEGTAGASSEENFSDLRLAPGTLSVGSAIGATGKLVIFDNSSEDNLYVGFKPNGYGLTYAGGTKAFSEVSDHLWQTDIVTLTASDVAGSFKVGLLTATPGSYVDCSTMTATDNAAALNTRKNALVTEQSYPAIPNLAAGQEGRFVIWDNDSHAGQQWYLCFLPVYSITYNDNGASSGSVPVDANKYRTNETPTVLGNSGSLAKEGYAFSGWNTAADGRGTAYTVGSNLEAIGDNVILYAQYRKAEITDVVLNAGIFEPVAAGDPETYVTADPTLDPTPAPTIKLCWELRYSNDNPVTGHDPISVSGNQVKFLLNGLAAGGYKIHVELRTGSTCGAGTLLSSYDKSFSIASDHIVTVQYKCGDFTLKASTNVGGKPLEWSDDITADAIDGYAFSSWTAGDGVTIKDSEGEDKTTSTEATIKIKANYDGTLTANYTKKRMIYFYNTLGWSGVTVYFYKNDSYWGDSGQGTGANTGWAFTDTPYSEGKHGDMTQIEGTDIWFFDCEAASVPSNYENVVFTEINQHGCDYFYNNNKVVRRGDYKTSLPMFVPLANQTPEDKNGGTAKYYNKGYWMNYPENTGYTLRIYSSSGASEPTRTIRFPFSNDKKMPLKLDVEFNEAATSYYYTIYREDGTVLSADYGMNTNYHSDVRLNDPSKKISIKTTAPGIYTFTLVYKNTPNLDYYISVDYPIVANDYRILYSDNATWSQGSAHTAGWSHPSDVIRKNTDAEVTQYDTVSFYIAKGDGITASMKFQYASEIVEAGTITWTDVTGGAITIPSSVVTKPGVYNFIIKQVGTADPVVEKVEPYTGNYYIRTDNAGSTKWDYYRSSDHQMTYTEFSMSDANSFGEKYSHYFAAWCVRGTNIKFCIANDYSSCISDTLSQDVGNPFDNTDTGGTLKSDGAGDPLYDRYSANVRFMYNQETNKISRAYVASSTNLSRLFLVLRGDEVVKAEDGSTELNDQGVSNGAILNDKENWIYERILYIKPNAKFKLFASYALLTPGRMDSVQYFRGAYVSGDSKASATFSDGSYVILISGTGGYQKARVIYDFKTNRLVCAWLPSDEPIDETLNINADVMVIRDHQEAAECITFSGDGELTAVKTVYGAMKFNRWTLNNRYRGKGGVEDNNKAHCDSPEDIAEYHGILPAGEQKSVYERSLYFISFPFDVKVSEIFGFGTYGKHWVLEYYDGLNRAKNGYWIDSPANWKYVTPSMAKTYELKAYEGYILCLSLGRMAYDNTEFWANNISNVELYFPSKTPMTNIQTTDVNISGLNEIAGDPYRCTINREGEDGDRRIKDSYWRCLGVPSYNLYAGQLKEGEGGSTINWQTNYNTFPFLYAWNMTDNTLTPQATNAFSFKPMHAYLTQIGTAIYWKNVSATPAVMARQTEEPTEYNWCLTLNAGEQMIDQTYVRMSTDEVITNEFDFGQDLSKELNTGRSDIYSFIGNERAAANSLQMNTETTTIVPLGLNIEATGEYTFSIPDGTNGIGITLIDEETGIRTSLSALDYTVELAAGDYTERFWLEISPVKGAETGIDPGVDARENGVRKVMIDGLLYIVRDGKMYDATGKRVE